MAHPYALTGHRYLAELLMHITQVALQAPPDPTTDQWRGRLPPPMIPNNEIWARTVCFTGDTLEPLAAARERFEWGDDSGPDNPKPGWMGNSTGAYVELELDTTVPRCVCACG